MTVGAQVRAAPISYAVDGEQYVANRGWQRRLRLRPRRRLKPSGGTAAPRGRMTPTMQMGSGDEDSDDGRRRPA